MTVSHETTTESRAKPGKVLRKTLCGCGRPRRRGQRNCDVCNANAQKSYRDRRRNELIELRALKQRLQFERMAENASQGEHDAHV
jgi:hypothetical protein